jgi:hypothetical protein
MLRDEGMIKEVMEGRIVGKRIRGRPRSGMLHWFWLYWNMKSRAEI